MYSRKNNTRNYCKEDAKNCHIKPQFRHHFYTPYWACLKFRSNLNVFNIKSTIIVLAILLLPYCETNYNWFRRISHLNLSFLLLITNAQWYERRRQNNKLFDTIGRPRTDPVHNESNTTITSVQMRCKTAAPPKLTVVTGKAGKISEITTRVLVDPRNGYPKARTFC